MTDEVEETKRVISELEVKLEELKKEPFDYPGRRRFEKPDYDSDNWVKCEVCGACDDVSPCDLCNKQKFTVMVVCDDGHEYVMPHNDEYPGTIWWDDLETARAVVEQIVGQGLTSEDDEVKIVVAYVVEMTRVGQ
jgi:hypothetical protein